MADKSIKQRTSTPMDETLPPWGVLVFESHHGHDFYMAPREHGFVKVLYILAGSGAVVDSGGGGRTECRPGDVLVVPAGWKHQLEDDSARPLSLYALCVEPTVWAKDPSLAGALPRGLVARKGRVSDRVRMGLRRLLFEQTSQRVGCAAIMCGGAMELLVVLARAEPVGLKSHGHEKGETLAKVRTYVRELDRRFYEATTIDDAAVELGIGRRRFTQLFREVTGRTWLHYVQERRLEYAKKLLRMTNRTVLAIAFECGYGDLSTFYRAFTGAIGCSPSSWRCRRMK